MLKGKEYIQTPFFTTIHVKGPRNQLNMIPIYKMEQFN